MNIPLNTNPSDEYVFAVCRMGLCLLAVSQKQPVFVQVAGSQLCHVYGFKFRKMEIVIAEIRTAVRTAGATPKGLFM